MADSESLDALANIMNDVAQSPFEYALHVRHIRLAESLLGMDAEAVGAREMMTRCFAVGDAVWVPLIEAKEKEVDLESEQGVKEVLEVYERAEADYLSIPILEKHIEFLIERHAQNPEVFSAEWTREALDGVVNKGLIHLTKSSNLWNARINWELEQLESASSGEKPKLIEHIHSLFQTRLKQTHSTMDETMQLYSSFVTSNFPAQEYEGMMLSASKMRAQSLRNYERREKFEMGLLQTQTQTPSHTAYTTYITYERRAKHPDLFVTRGIYERAIADAARRVYLGEGGAQGVQEVEAVMRAFWVGYCDVLRILEAGVDVQLETYRRAVRSVPGSGEVWARYIRFLERTQSSLSHPQDLETISDVYDRALSTTLVQKDVNELVEVVLARAGYEKRRFEGRVGVRGVDKDEGRAQGEGRMEEDEDGGAEEEDEDILPNLIALLEMAIEMAYKASKVIDPALRMERFLVEVYENAGLTESVLDVWKAATKHAKSSVGVWLKYTEALAKTNPPLARQTFHDQSTKNLDWPEALWAAWVGFEHVRGDVGSIERAVERVGWARGVWEGRRGREGQGQGQQGGWSQTGVQGQGVGQGQQGGQGGGGGRDVSMGDVKMQEQVEGLLEDVRVGVVGRGLGDVDMGAPASKSTSTNGGVPVSVPVPMQVDAGGVKGERGTKRGAEDEGGVGGDGGGDAGGRERERGVGRGGAGVEHKKARVEPAPLLKRDRENSTVFVGELPDDTKEGDLVALFKDCGSVREAKITKLGSSVVATVEFIDRESIPAALTKDKKRIRGQEVAVHLAWKSTLYVTNFPESADDKLLRGVFGEYGTIFDVRWPSKKFKSTRRFCYLQFTSPTSAEKALELHGRELAPNLPLNVYISNPERKKERTDVDADEKEVYVAGLSRYTNKMDLERVFRTYGTVKDVRIALDDGGHARGYAFVEFEEPAEALRALGANNYELKKRRIGVTLVDPRVRARHKSDIGLSRVAETRTRSVYVRNLPLATQEGLLQQAFEKVGPVKRVEVFLDRREAVVEMESQADAGRLLLHPEPIVFGGNELKLSEDVPVVTKPKGGAEPPFGSGGGGGGAKAGTPNPVSFKPRKVAAPRAKMKAGLGFKGPGPGTSGVKRAEGAAAAAGGREGGADASGSGSGAGAGSAVGTKAEQTVSSGKGQDDFRKMLMK